MPPPIQTYYENSPEEQEDLLELRKDYYRTLRSLQRRAARYGDAGVPAPIASAIAEAEANIRAIDEARGGWSRRPQPSASARPASLTF